MPLRPMSPVMRSMVLCGMLVTSGSAATIDVVHRWPLAIASPSSDPIRLAVNTATLVTTSPLSFSATILFSVILIVIAARWVLGPSGLQTPE